VERIGSGSGLAVLFNGRAKRVTAAVVRLLAEALPKALVLVSHDLEEARRHAKALVAAKPAVVLSGGGDGAAVRLVNLLAQEGGAPLPSLGVLKLGTGNAWARVSGAGRYAELVAALPRLPLPLPTLRYDLVEVEGALCHFAGVGWDARILNDYQRNLDRRAGQLVGSRFASRLHKGLPGYLYSIVRHTIPEEMQLLRKLGQPRVKLTSDDPEALRADERGELQPLPQGSRLLFEGNVSVGAAGTTTEWGFGLRAFPMARKVPGRINLRVYDRPVLEAARNAPRIWRGQVPLAGMHDFFARRATMTFSRPMPFQIGGDAVGLREEVTYTHASHSVQLVDWAAARALS
jgi:diacylglycerol kinase family enzyme